ncbi:MAG: hypothetical protein RBR35_15925 [Salinivirgaceae bacterium]|nr:hypothetical protein [Salinivirgaceae bacterium]
MHKVNSNRKNENSSFYVLYQLIKPYLINVTRTAVIHDTKNAETFDPAFNIP